MDEQSDEQDPPARSSRTRAKRPRSQERPATKRKAPKTESKPSVRESKDSNDDDEDDASVKSKRERNKLSASKYRKRRKMLMKNLEESVSEMKEKLGEESRKLAAASSENQMLKKQLDFLKNFMRTRKLDIPKDFMNISSKNVAAPAGLVLFALFSFVLLFQGLGAASDQGLRARGLTGHMLYNPHAFEALELNETVVDERWSEPIAKDIGVEPSSIPPLDAEHLHENEAGVDRVLSWVPLRVGVSTAPAA